MGNPQIVLLREVTTLITKGTTPTTLGYTFTDSGVNFIKAESVTLDGQIDESVFAHIDEETHTKLQRSQIEEGDILFSIAGMKLGKSAVVKSQHIPANTNQAVAIIRADRSKALPEFLHYHFLNPDHYRYVNAITAQAAQPNINLGQVGSLPISLPPLPIQRRIAEILSAYDELIENTQRRIKILEAMARALYREWFVHFRFPGHESIPRVPSPLGEIPKGWEVKKLGDVAKTFRGRSYRSMDLSEDGGLPFLNLKCLDRDGGFRRSGLKRYTGEFKDIQVAKKGDIVMAVTDMTQERRIVARATLVPTLDNEFGIFSMDLVRIEPRPAFPKAFLYSFLRYSSFADEVKQHANGANVLHLSPDRITDYRLAVPPTELISGFANFAGSVAEEIDTLANSIDNLRLTRDLLLPRLLSGQVRLEMEVA